MLEESAKLISIQRHCLLQRNLILTLFLAQFEFKEKGAKAAKQKYAPLWNFYQENHFFFFSLGSYEKSN